MNKIKVILEACVCSLLLLVCNACSSDGTDEVTSNGNVSESILNDMSDYASQQENLFSVANTAPTTRAGKVSSNAISNANIAQFEANLSAFMKKHDIYADLTDAEKAKYSSLTDDEKEMMKLDPEQFLSFVKENKSDEFYEVCKKLMSTGKCDFSTEEIIESKNMKMNEKIVLLTVLPAFNSKTVMTTRATAKRFLSYSNESASGNSKCLTEYNNAKNWCAATFLASSALSCCGGPTVVTVAGLAMAYASYQDCESNANFRYKACLGIQ